MAESSIGRRRIAALSGIGALAAMLMIAGCSSSSTTSTASSSTAASTSAPAATGSSSAAAGGSPITVGIICDCTGAFAGVLTDGAKVYQAWANTVNTAGGINGHPVKVDLVDDQSNPGNSLTDVENLVNQDHVAALLDETDLDETWASFAKAHNVPVIGANITEAPFYTNSDFYAEGATEDALFPGVIDAAKGAGATSIGLLYCAEAVQCQEGVAPMKKLSASMGLPLKYDGEISATAPNYTAQCVAAQQAGVTSLFIADIAAVAAKVAQDCSQQGYHPVYVLDGVDIDPQFPSTPGLKDDLVGPVRRPAVLRQLAGEHRDERRDQQVLPGPGERHQLHHGRRERLAVGAAARGGRQGRRADRERHPDLSGADHRADLAQGRDARRDRAGADLSPPTRRTRSTAGSPTSSRTACSACPTGRSRPARAPDPVKVQDRRRRTTAPPPVIPSSPSRRLPCINFFRSS